MGNWFGSLDLAYKYTIVFASLLALTIFAGFIKVFLDRRKLKKLSEQKDEEGSPREEQMELTHREKDEGDLFGIRAIEAGYFAGIPQSRPTSRAGSVVGGPTMSSSTLVGGFNSPKIQTHSMASSVTSLPLAHTNDRNRDSETLPASLRRASPPAIKLLPSEAELSGRINHNATVNMNLNVPPSPVSSKFGGSDSGESDTHTLRSEHYAPIPAQAPVENNLRVSVVSVNSPHKSHAASVNDPSPLHSPSRSGPPSPRHRPASYVPSMPDRAYDDDSRSQPLGYHQPEQPQKMMPEAPASPTMLLPHTYQPLHQRDASDSSTYSEHGNSTIKAKHDRKTSTGSSYNFSLPDRNTVATGKEPAHRSKSASTLAPKEAANDPRFSEFYDAYFRNSQLNFGLSMDAPAGQKRLHVDLVQPTIAEVPSPLVSPEPRKTGVAL